MASDAPLKRVVDRRLDHQLDTRFVSITDTLECGHTYTRHVANNGDLKTYSPAIRRRCQVCVGKEVN